MKRTEACLVLSDGTLFEGWAMGAHTDVVTGEVVFNTVMSGYQEVISDPSYSGQIITFTYPHIGNYGTAEADNESRKPFCRGVVIRDLPPMFSNWRAGGDLDSYLKQHGVAGIAGIDTRRLTRHIREYGALPAAFGPASESDVRNAAITAKTTDGIDSVADVTTSESYIALGNGPLKIVAYDYGIKTTIIRQLMKIGTVEVVPASTSAADVLAREPNGVFLSNGPGDPAAVGYARENIQNLLGEVPIFGICLGHQLLGAALGGETHKLQFGHHGGNHPVKNLSNGTVEITSQNHNYALTADSGADLEVTHVNLNDQVVEGLKSTKYEAFSVQYHPEAGPGPHDSRYLFEQFANSMAKTKVTVA